MIQLNIFSKMVILLIFLLVFMVAMYSYSNYKTQSILREEIMRSQLQQLDYFSTQVDTAMNQAADLSSSLLNDPHIRDFGENYEFINNYESIWTVKTIEKSLTTRSHSGNSLLMIAIHSPPTGNMVSSSSAITALTETPEFSQWVFRRSNPDIPGYFAYYSIEPFYAKNKDEAQLISEVRFPERTLIRMLDEFKATTGGDPFLYHPGLPPIYSMTADEVHLQHLLNALGNKQFSERGNFSVSLNNEEYVVQYEQTKASEWYLINYVPMHHLMQPIKNSQHLFYMSTGVILILSILACMLLYRQVQVPIRRLMKSLQMMKKGVYSVRVQENQQGEFQFLYKRFNEMAEQIQVLFEKVYREKLRSREASLKQLQSQINPHFLYNCLYFIKNMAEMGDEENVVKMTLNLGEYYRYTTRVGKQTTTLEGELKLVQNYLEIQKLRMRRIDYKINVPDHMYTLEIPRLIFQPIVENAIIHGLEPKISDGIILITGMSNGSKHELIVEDDGIGMTEEERQTLDKRLKQKWDDGWGCGTWNVHQRLRYKYGDEAGIFFESRSNGGMRFILRWYDHSLQ